MPVHPTSAYTAMTMGPITDPRLLQVVNYLNCHLDKKPDTARIAKLCGLSKASLHRQFSYQFGIGLQTLMRIIRLRRAAWQLAFRPGQSITEIALQAQFDSTEGFARAFKRYCRQTPLDFRKTPSFEVWQHMQPLIEQMRTAPNAQPRAGHRAPLKSSEPHGVEHFSSIAIALSVHRGAGLSLMQHVAQFIAWRRTAGQVPPKSRTFTVFYEDPYRVASPRTGLAASVDSPVADNRYGVEYSTLPAMYVAKQPVTGDERKVSQAMQALMLTYHSQLALEFHPPFVERLAWYPDVPAQSAKHIIYLPLVNPSSVSEGASAALRARVSHRSFSGWPE
ncbi:AraC family transcriptional regulator [Salinimonas sediminis]|uniref:AraC family transcriptional regulator n=2 Tax=Salinimonas sediminis TaxID=2303538 RepID=A0A346NL67_9ALTE|nr:AraC family transcriptional regulator [Salinimonas sediminis]